jgi:hypothetical protein
VTEPVQPVAANASAASSASLVASASAPALPFRRDGDDLSFPLGGALLLLALLAVAVWAWTVGRRRGASAPRLAFPFQRPAGAAEEPVRIVGGARLDVGGRVHVVEWRGQQVLVAINGASPPVVLARRRLAEAAKGDA